MKGSLRDLIPSFNHARDVRITSHHQNHQSHNYRHDWSSAIILTHVKMDIS